MRSRSDAVCSSGNGLRGLQRAAEAQASFAFEECADHLINGMLASDERADLGCSAALSRET
jgi:hypothetical protein